MSAGLSPCSAGLAICKVAGTVNIVKNSLLPSFHRAPLPGSVPSVPAGDWHKVEISIVAVSCAVAARYDALVHGEVQRRSVNLVDVTPAAAEIWGWEQHRGQTGVRSAAEGGLIKQSLFA